MRCRQSTTVHGRSFFSTACGSLAGYAVVGISASAKTALDLAGRHTPDLILMDIRLQGARDGIEAAVEVRRRMDIP